MSPDAARICIKIVRYPFPFNKIFKIIGRRNIFYLFSDMLFKDYINNIIALVISRPPQTLMQKFRICL
jgi:hypothetical protein